MGIRALIRHKAQVTQQEPAKDLRSPHARSSLFANLKTSQPLEPKQLTYLSLSERNPREKLASPLEVWLGVTGSSCY